MCDLACWGESFYQGLVIFNLAVFMTLLGITVAALIFYGRGGPPSH